MSTAVINVPISLEVYGRLERVAAHLAQPIETVLDETLRTILPTETGIPTTLQREIAALSTLTTEELHQVAGSEMSSEDQVAIEQLLYWQNMRSLTQRELAKLEKLRTEYGRVLVRKARAFALLAERGQPAPF
ncbi:MAG: hypothetical protein DYG89_07720 [Caldilinea sp. CFX5]|nr:hypothetical protein [Caldilinea sp. CFX5]